MSFLAHSIAPSSVSQISKRKTAFLYLEHASIHQAQHALEVVTPLGRVAIPLNSIAALMLGPGTTISDKAIKLIGDMGVTTIWVGEVGVRYYASGEPLTKKDTFIRAQSKLVSSRRQRLAVAMKMYQKRFPDIVVDNYGLNQLRGMEGSRVREIYREQALLYDYPWARRTTRIKDIPEGDPVNSAITMATSALYGIVHATIVAVGASPSLGFIHSGHINSFVFDIADLYKTDIAVPCAFKVTSNYDANEGEATLDHLVRQMMKQEIKDRKLISTIINDIKLLFGITEEIDFTDEVQLWDINRFIPGGVNYG